MKFKSLLFGSAALLAAGTGAQAADLPIAEPVDYVRICDAFGVGFYYIPGTDTCLRISGRVRIGATYVDGDIHERSGHVDDEDEFNNYATRARGVIRADARTQTDFGLVRAFIEYEMNVGYDSFSEDDDPNYSGTSPALVHAYIQLSNDWGTFTAGHTSSFYDFWGSNTFGDRVFIDDQTGEQTLFAYTFGAGNGISATLSLEDAASGGRRYNGRYENYEGQEMPDLVGNIRIDQGWGSAQVMGVLHQVHEEEGGDDGGLGWSVGAGLNIGLPFGLGFNSQIGYAEGALGYITTDPLGLGDLDDGGDSLNTAWMVRAGLTADWTPTVSSSLDASYTSLEEDNDGFFDEGYDFWAIVANLVWSPVDGLLMGPEVAYTRVDVNEEGFAVGADRFFEDSDIWGVMFRIQRDF